MIKGRRRRCERHSQHDANNTRVLTTVINSQVNVIFRLINKPLILCYARSGHRGLRDLHSDFFSTTTTTTTTLLLLPQHTVLLLLYFLPASISLLIFVRDNIIYSMKRVCLWCGLYNNIIFGLKYNWQCRTFRNVRSVTETTTAKVSQQLTVTILLHYP